MSPEGDTVTTGGVPEVYPLYLIIQRRQTGEERTDRKYFVPFFYGLQGRYDNYLVELPESLYTEIDSG